RLVVDAGERARDAVRQSGDGRRRAEGACDARNAKAPAKGAGAYHAGDLLVVIASPRLALAALRAVARGDAITVRVRASEQLDAQLGQSEWRLSSARNRSRYGLPTARHTRIREYERRF